MPDQDGLLRWLDAFEKKPKHIFVVHGESSVCDSFAALCAERYHRPVTAPDFLERYDLITGELLEKGVKPQPKKPAAVRASGVFARLVAAGQRLLKVIQHNEGGTNKDLARFCRPDQFPVRQMGPVAVPDRLHYKTGMRETSSRFYNAKEIVTGWPCKTGTKADRLYSPPPDWEPSAIQFWGIPPVCLKFPVSGFSRQLYAKNFL